MMARVLCRHFCFFVLAGALSGSREVLDNVEFVFEAPPRGQPALGLLMLAHGCSHSATDFWPRGDRCAACIGLPIETRIVSAALARGWAVVAVSSLNREAKCWQPRLDVPRVTSVLEHLVGKLGPVPIAAFGASSGGALVTRLPGLISCVSQIMPSAADVESSEHTPVRFVHMARDVRRAAVIGAQVEALRSAGVDADALIVDPSPLTPSALRGRGGGAVPTVLDARTAEIVIAALQKNGLADASGMLLEDPRRSRWREALRPLVPYDSLVADASPLSEVLNEAWAFHEITDAFVEEWLDWLDAKRDAARV